MVNIDDLQWFAGAPAELEAGMVIQDAAGARYLVGDVNNMGGVCNDCRLEVEVVRWADLRTVLVGL